MIGYVTLGTNQFDTAAKFYDELLGTIDCKRGMEADSFIAWTNGNRDQTMPVSIGLNDRHDSCARCGASYNVEVVFERAEPNQCPCPKRHG